MAEGIPTRDGIVRAQLASLAALLVEVRQGNHFYREKLNLSGLDQPVNSLSDFRHRFPLTTKLELTADHARHPPYGTNLTYPRARYCRFSQTSGTTGQPLRWLDTEQSWQWMINNWKIVFCAAGVAAEDTIFFAFSFGPFIGFWLAFEAGVQLGALCLPGGGLSSLARLRLLIDNHATVLCCTPTYAIRLAEVAHTEGIELAQTKIRRIIVAGEPGGSIPATRARIEGLWPGASIFDHHGMTEVGPVTYPCPESPGNLRIIESAYLAEVVDPASGEPVPPGERGELVLTTLGRHASPAIRFRTGDLVEPQIPESSLDPNLILRGGILGRIDDMVTIRGVNLYPSAIESIVRSLPEIAEYQVEIGSSGALEELLLIIEPIPDVLNTADLLDRLAGRLRSAFPLRIQVQAASPGELPRYELKARRWKRLEAAKS